LKLDFTAEELSHYFSSFRKSEQVIVYDQAVKDVSVLVKALDIHLRGIASGKVFETYQLDRLGEWVGWCFPNHTQNLDKLVSKALITYAKSPKKIEVFNSFNKGLMFGRSEAKAAIKDGSISASQKVSFEAVHPA
jgi:hypothetical protein